MQSIDHKGLCVKCDNVGLLRAIDYSHTYLGNLDCKEWILCVLEILFICRATMIQGNNWRNLISLLLLFIELGKILLGIYYAICVINCTVIKSAMYWFKKYFVFSHAFVVVFTLSICLLLLHFNISSNMNSVIGTCKLSYFMIIKLLVCNSTANMVNVKPYHLYSSTNFLFLNIYQWPIEEGYFC
jgi:hypothetical protein